jgi:hypothetical protein
MMTPNKKTARLAGLFFLLMVVFGLFSEIFFRQKLFVTNDVAATANNILSNEFLYRTGIASDILMSLCYLFTALALYKLLAPVNKDMAATMVVFAAAGSIMLLCNIQNEVAPLTILSGNKYLGAFSPSQLQSLAMLSYQSYGHGYVTGQVFFALWVLPLGVLIYRSRFIPKAFGILFVVEAILALLAVFVHFLFPNESTETILLVPGTIAEFSFMFWLLIRGINESKLLVQEIPAKANVA